LSAKFSNSANGKKNGVKTKAPWAFGPWCFFHHVASVPPPAGAHNKDTPKGGSIMPKDVLCEVNTCTYWGQGNLCKADEIYVVTHTEQAKDTKETDCKTFKPKH
jgi:hypothetical protein